MKVRWHIQTLNLFFFHVLLFFFPFNDEFQRLRYVEIVMSNWVKVSGALVHSFFMAEAIHLQSCISS